MRHDGPELLRLIRTVTDAPLRTVVYSHAHIDHAFGHGPLLAEAAERGDPPPRIVAHRAVVDRFRRYIRTADLNTTLNARQSGGPRTWWPRHDTDVFRPDTVYDDTLTLRIGGAAVERVAAVEGARLVAAGAGSSYWCGTPSAVVAVEGCARSPTASTTAPHRIRQKEVRCARERYPCRAFAARWIGDMRPPLSVFPTLCVLASDIRARPKAVARIGLGRRGFAQVDRKARSRVSCPRTVSSSTSGARSTPARRAHSAQQVVNSRCLDGRPSAVPLTPMATTASGPIPEGFQVVGSKGVARPAKTFRLDHSGEICVRQSYGSGEALVAGCAVVRSADGAAHFGRSARTVRSGAGSRSRSRSRSRSIIASRIRSARSASSPTNRRGSSALIRHTTHAKSERWVTFPLQPWALCMVVDTSGLVWRSVATSADKETCGAYVTSVRTWPDRDSPGRATGEPSTSGVGDTLGAAPGPRGKRPGPRPVTNRRSGPTPGGRSVKQLAHPGPMKPYRRFRADVSAIPARPAGRNHRVENETSPTLQQRRGR